MPVTFPVAECLDRSIRTPHPACARLPGTWANEGVAAPRGRGARSRGVGGLRSSPEGPCEFRQIPPFVRCGLRYPPTKTSKTRRPQWAPSGTEGRELGSKRRRLPTGRTPGSLLQEDSGHSGPGAAHAPASLSGLHQDELLWMNRSRGALCGQWAIGLTGRGEVGRTEHWLPGGRSSPLSESLLEMQQSTERLLEHVGDFPLPKPMDLGLILCLFIVPTTQCGRT